VKKKIENKGLDSSLEKVGVEVKAIYEDLMRDLTSAKTKMKLLSCQPSPCLEVKEVFDIKTRFEMSFSANWSDETIENINTGISGLILEEFEKDNIFSQEVFETFFSLFNKQISKNRILKALLLQRSLEEIEKKYENKYKLVEIKEVFVHFIKEENGSIVPYICMEVQIERI